MENNNEEVFDELIELAKISVGVILENEFTNNNKVSIKRYKNIISTDDWIKLLPKSCQEFIISRVRNTEKSSYVFDMLLDTYTFTKLDYLLSEGFAYKDNKDYVLYTDDELAHELADVGKYV